MLLKTIKNFNFLLVTLSFLLTSCNKKSELDNQITITINSVDKNTKKRRINLFDTIEVRKENFGFLKKNFTVDKQYVTDSMGAIKIKLDKSKIYEVSVLGLNKRGGDMYYPGFLKDGQELNIEITSFDE